MRVLVVWCPDWPVVAAEAGPATPAAVVTRSAVVACNARARDQGVRRGMRRRDAQSRCPELVLVADNPDRDVRAFEPVLAAVEALRPGVASLRPGMLAIRSPGRFYGGEEHAAAVIAERLVSIGVWDVRIGIADDLFTAEQAARSAEVQGWRVIETGRSAPFLGDLPVEVLDSGFEASQ
jgi:protein ImuB